MHRRAVSPAPPVGSPAPDPASGLLTVGATPALHARKRKAALVIGIGYFNNATLAALAPPLTGAVEDAHALSKFLLQKGGHTPSTMVVLTDGIEKFGKPAGWKGEPTRANIMHALTAVISESASLDELWISFSGHAVGVKDVDGDESSETITGQGYDEAMLPVDYAGHLDLISDDELSAGLQRIAPTCRTFILMDCCHSGSICDLPYSYDQSSQQVTAKIGARRFGANYTPSIVQFAAATDTQEAVDLGGSGWLTQRLLGALVRSNYSITVRQLVHALEARKLLDERSGAIFAANHGSVGKASQITTVALSHPALLDTPVCGAPDSHLVPDFWGADPVVFHTASQSGFAEREWEDGVDSWYDTNGANGGSDCAIM